MDKNINEYIDKNINRYVDKNKEIYIENLRNKSPLIHNITNMVTINDVANIELACGARPIMAMAPQEAEEVTGICNGLNLNIGTPSKERFEAMSIAAAVAQKKGIPIILDLVGVGVSNFRMEFVLRMLANVKIDVIKGNLSEIKSLMGRSNCDGGVEVSDTDAAEVVKEIAMQTALKYHCIVAITGETDYIAQSQAALKDNFKQRAQNNFLCESIRGGNAMMKKVTGTGCQLSGLICSFVSANPDDKYGAVKTALYVMKKAGEMAAEEMNNQNKTGNASYRSKIIDSVYRICEN